MLKLKFMKYRLVKIDKLSENKASVYSVKCNDDETIFEKFVKENEEFYEEERKKLGLCKKMKN